MFKLLKSLKNHLGFSSDEKGNSPIEAKNPKIEGLVSLDPAQVEASFVMWGDTYLSLPTSRLVQIARAGDRFPEKFLERFKAGKVTIGVEEPHWLLECQSMLLKMKTAFLEEEKDFSLLPGAKLNPLLQEWLFMPLFERPRDPALLDFIYLCGELFGKPNEEALRQYDGADTELFQRSCRVSALGVHLALVMGYYEKSFLEEIWQSFFLLDYALASDYLLEREEYRKGVREWRQLGRGASIESLTPSEVQKIESHAKRSEEIVTEKRLLKSNFVNVEGLISHHHERADATGPEGISSYVLNEVENLAILSDRLADSPEGKWAAEFLKMKEKNWKGMNHTFCEALYQNLVAFEEKNKGYQKVS